jgi:hypothetical protein
MQPVNCKAIVAVQTPLLLKAELSKIVLDYDHTRTRFAGIKGRFALSDHHPGADAPPLLQKEGSFYTEGALQFIHGFIDRRYGP